MNYNKKYALSLMNCSPEISTPHLKLHFCFIEMCEYQGL